ncbi:hypothetical protein GGS26DRAFT_401145 [Hypomontagnella submonticulosa]|nr:hypothetical protein GGS26DRAFT_401145 [Hypomontagnella submonticulosa]
MPRTRTRRAAQDTFTRPFPAAVVYDLSIPDQATIRVPAGSSWTSGPHWHDAHTEYLQVLSGRARVTLGDREFCVGAGDGVVTVPRGVVHEWRRADVNAGRLRERGAGKGVEMEELVVREWTEPKDGAKEVFFRNLNGLILDAAAGERRGKEGKGVSAWGEAILTLELWNLFWRADNYPVTLGPGWVGRVATRVMMGAAVALGWVVGCCGVYEEYGAK